MSKYVPPHRRKDIELDEGDTASLKVQKATWDALSRSITRIFNQLDMNNAEVTATELLRENIIRGRGLVAQAAIRVQHLNADLTPAIVAVLSKVNQSLPQVVLLLCQRLVVEWHQAYRRKDWLRVQNIQIFLCWLYIFHIVENTILLEILLTLLTSRQRNDDDIELAAHLFRNSFKAMEMRCRRDFHGEVLPIFRDILAMDTADGTSTGEERLSVRSQAVLERCLKDVQIWEKTKDQEPLIPENLVLVDLDDGDHPPPPCHSLTLEEDYAVERELDRFRVDAKYEENEAKYESFRRKLFGENWELQLLEEHIANAEEEEEAEREEMEEGREGRMGEKGEGKDSASSSSSPKANQTAPTDSQKVVVDKQERELRKEVYLAIRGSVRADEVVHKLLKHIKQGTERTICFMVIEGCCEERAYKRIYEMAAERLCKSRVRFQPFFIEAFQERYRQADELTLKQVEYSTSLFAHLLRTESIFWGRCLCVMNILENNESQRLFIQHLFRSLGERMGMESLVKRVYEDKDVISMGVDLFPLEARDEAVLERAINLLVAMSLGPLTTPLRQALDARLASRKRTRE